MGLGFLPSNRNEDQPDAGLLQAYEPRVLTIVKMRSSLRAKRMI